MGSAQYVVIFLTTPPLSTYILTSLDAPQSFAERLKGTMFPRYRHVGHVSPSRLLFARGWETVLRESPFGVVPPSQSFV